MNVPTIKSPGVIAPFVHDINIETRILFETAGGIGATSVRELFARAQLGAILSPLAPVSSMQPPFAAYPRPINALGTSNELPEINACERANHTRMSHTVGHLIPTKGALGTYLRISTASRDLGVLVRIRSCNALFHALRSRLIATANSSGYSVKTSPMGPPLIRKAAPGGRVELVVYAGQLMAGDRFGGREVATLDPSRGPLRASISMARPPQPRVIIFNDGSSITREDRTKIMITRAE